MLTALALLAQPALADDLRANSIDPDRPRVRLDLAKEDTTSGARQIQILVESANGALEQVATPIRSEFRTTQDVSGKVQGITVTAFLETGGPHVWFFPGTTKTWTRVAGEDGWFARARDTDTGIEIAVARRQGGDISTLSYIRAVVETTEEAAEFEREVTTVRQVFSAEPWAELLTDLDQPGQVSLDVRDADGTILASQTTYEGGPANRARIVRAQLRETNNGSTRMITTVLGTDDASFLSINSPSGEPLLEGDSVERGRITSFATPVSFKSDPTGTTFKVDLYAPSMEFGTELLTVEEGGSVTGFDGEWGALYLRAGKSPTDWWLVANYTQDPEAPLDQIVVVTPDFEAVLKPVEESITSVTTVAPSDEGYAVVLEGTEGAADGFTTLESEGVLRSTGPVADVDDLLFRMAGVTKPTSRLPIKRVKRRRL